jgi:hypothetical protein
MYKILCICLVFSINAQSQIVSKYWHVSDVRNTLLELGVKTPTIQDFEKTRKQYIGASIIFLSNYFLFSKKLSFSDCYSDTVFIQKKHIVPRKKDTYVSFRYPGDELACNSLVENCYVGDAFMKLINFNAKSLTYYDGIGNKPNKFSYKICVLSAEKIALLCDNANIVLLLTKGK